MLHRLNPNDKLNPWKGLLVPIVNARRRETPPAGPAAARGHGRAPKPPELGPSSRWRQQLLGRWGQGLLAVVRPPGFRHRLETLHASPRAQSVEKCGADVRARSRRRAPVRACACACTLTRARVRKGRRQASKPKRARFACVLGAGPLAGILRFGCLSKASFGDVARWPRGGGVRPRRP